MDVCVYGTFLFFFFFQVCWRFVRGIEAEK